MDGTSFSRVLGGFFCLSLISLTGCNGLLGGDTGPSQYEPNYSLSPPPHAAALPCGNSDPSHLCIALKYVVYEDGYGQSIVSRSQAASNIQAINSVWSQCQVQFTLENYQAINAASYGLVYNDASMDDLGAVRAALSDSTTMLVATTGQWTGVLGAQPANAWTLLPGQGPFGTVLEQSVAFYPDLIAHELGHYLNLAHVNNVANVMNPMVYPNSVGITADQCKEARATAISFWPAMLR